MSKTPEAKPAATVGPLLSALIGKSSSFNFGKVEFLLRIKLVHFLSK